MTEQIRDPELDRLVRELNRQQNAPAEDELEAVPGAAGVRSSTLDPFEPLDKPAQSRVEEGGTLDRLLLEMIHQKASDLLLIAGLSPVFRIDGRLIRADAAPLEDEELGAMFRPHMGERARRGLDERGSADSSMKAGASIASG
jgi:hypothetical protein